MNEEIKLIELHLDYAYIMYILCDKTASYYSKIKNIINIPIIICATGLSLTNTYNGDAIINSDVRYISIVLNMFIAVSIGILNIYKITEKEYFFSTYSVQFLKIYNELNVEISKAKISCVSIDANRVIIEYNILCEHIKFHIPSHIRNNIIKSYKKYKMPILLSFGKIEKKKGLLTYFKKKYSDDKQSIETEQSDTTSSSISFYISDSNTCTPISHSYTNAQYVPNMSPIASIGMNSPTCALKPYVYNIINNMIHDSSETTEENIEISYNINEYLETSSNIVKRPRLQCVKKMRFKKQFPKRKSYIYILNNE